MSDLLVSIIVPVYNVDKFLEKCVTSLLAQTVPNFELLLINDGSTDVSGQICESFKNLDPRVRVFHKGNGGVSSARNLGIENAKGVFLCFVDSDDWVKDDFLNNFKTKDYNADFYVQGYSDNSYIDSSVKLVGFSKCGYFRDLTPFEHGFKNVLFNGPCCKLYKRCLIESAKLTFDESLSYGEDTLFVLSYLNLIQSMVVSDSHSYIYQRRPSSLTYRFVDFYKLQYLASETRRLHTQLIQKWNLNNLEHLDAVDSSFVSNFIVSLNSLFHPKSSIKGSRRYVEFSRSVDFINCNKDLFKKFSKSAYKRVIFRLLTTDFVGKEAIFCFQAFLRFIYLDRLRWFRIALWQTVKPFF